MGSARDGVVMWSVWALVACRNEPEPPRGKGAELVVNEVLARNDRAWPDPDAPADGCPAYPDLVELWNASDRELELSAYTLEDSAGVAHRLAGALPSGAYLLLLADDDDADGHLPFALSAAGETLVLRGDRGVVDRVEIPPADPDRSWGRFGDGGGVWRSMIPTPGAANERPPVDGCFDPAVARPPGAFDDHSTPCLATREGFDSVAVGRAGLHVTKLEILGFPETDSLEVRFLDSRFYALHDEWYLYRMLNGAPVRGEDRFEPWDGGDFASIDEIYAWAYSTDLAARFPESYVTITPTGRVYSPRFYELALDEPRRIGAGTLVHVDADRDGVERWLFELEHSDEISIDHLRAYFHTLERSLGSEVGGTGAPAAQRLRWLARSTYQEELARALAADGDPLGERFLTYGDLSEPGAVEVYRGGTVAGTVFLVRGGENLEDARPTDILVVDQVPDYLPPCAALITTVPQTPLAHVAILAESRGIPNLSIAGLTNDPGWDAWGRVRTPIALRATPGPGGGTVEYRALESDEWLTWQTLQQSAAPVLEEVSTAGLPWVVDLATVPVEEMREQRPVLGGKSAGYLALLHTPGVATPDPVFGVTIRAYVEQLAPLGATVTRMLADPAFGHPGDERVRYLVLEGRAAYDERYPTTADALAADAWVASHDGALAGFAVADGLTGAVRAMPLADDVRRGVVDALADAYAELAPEQGLRFRSSSNVEDAEGFVGAGLYTSNTGYLDPSEGDPVADAMLATFASYWGAEAFEERHAAGLDHANGAMGLAVHPNFQDEAERSNGVLHLVRLPDGTTELTVNSQDGAISVTNPPVDTCTLVLPQVDVIRGSTVGDGVVEHLQDSTERPVVLREAELLALYDMALPVLDTWLAVENDPLPPEWRRTTLTLDLEYREVVDQWPLYADGRGSGERLVLKQCRSLEPSAAPLPDELEALPFPRDLLGRARIVTRSACAGGTVWSALTDPAKPPDLGHTEIPFVAQVEVGGESATWVEFAAQSGSRVVLGAEAAARLGVAEIRLGGCADETLWASPATWLDDLLDD